MKRPPFFAAAGVLFAVLALIASTLHGGFFRNTMGDYLVVIFIYCLVAGLIKMRPVAAGAITFAIATAIESGQALGLDKLLGVHGTAFGAITLGANFDWLDIIAYALGAASAVAIDLTLRSRMNRPQ